MKIDKTYQYEERRFDLALGTVNTFMSNFHQLKNPIVDEYGFEYFNSEGYYMALRTDDIDAKKDIASLSKLGGRESKSAKRKYKLEMNENFRVEFMKAAVYAKFDANPDLQHLLELTKNKEIIEKNWWHDNLFGVCDRKETLCPVLCGANILGKTLMDYRDDMRIKNMRIHSLF